MLALFYYTIQPTVSVNFKILAGAVLLSEIYDLVWLLFYAGHWLEGGGTMEDGIRRFSAFAVLVNFVLKLGVGAVFWKNSIDLS